MEISGVYRERLVEQNLMNSYLIDKTWLLYKEFYNLVNDIHVKCGIDNHDDDDLRLCYLILCYLPYAYVTGQINKLKDRLDAPESRPISNDYKDILKYYVGD